METEVSAGAVHGVVEVHMDKSASLMHLFRLKKNRGCSVIFFFRGGVTYKLMPLFYSNHFLLMFSFSHKSSAAIQNETPKKKPKLESKPSNGDR